MMQNDGESIYEFAAEELTNCSHMYNQTHNPRSLCLRP